MEGLFGTTVGGGSEYHFRWVAHWHNYQLSGQVRCDAIQTGEAHDPGVREDGGITISRRPNRRPSSEKAPGPSNASATAVIVIANATSLASCKAQEGAGNQENAIPRKQIPTSNPAIGVRNPAARAVPLMIKTSPRNHFSENDVNGPERQEIPPAAAKRPTAVRKSRRPMPGLPPGNVEYSLCSANLPGAP